MTDGVVTGGWSFVIAAYLLTAVVLLIYGITLFTRLREERGRALSVYPERSEGSGASREQ